MYSYDEENIAALIEDFTDTIEIESFSRQMQQRFDGSWRSAVGEEDTEADGEERGVVTVQDSACCYYKYLHRLPHEHAVVSRAVQCGSGRLRQSNNHNKDHDSPPLLRESQRFSKSFKDTPSTSLYDLNNLDTFTMYEHSKTDASKKVMMNSSIFMEDTDYLPQQYVIEVNSENGTFNKNGNNINNSEEEDKNKEKEKGTKNNIDILKETNVLKPQKLLNTLSNCKKQYKPIYLGSKKDLFHDQKMFENKNQVRGKYCWLRNVEQKFFLTENANIENIIQDSNDRRIKSVCDRYNCNIDVYSKVIRNGYRKNIIVLSAPNDEFLRKCVRSLDHNMKWCLTCQLKH